MPPIAPLACPTDDILESAAHDGPLEPDVRTHISSCAACQTAVDEIRSNNAFLADCAPVISASTARADSIPGCSIVGELHRGGQGVVYKAVHKATRRTVAVKVMRGGPFAGPADRARFEREAQILAQLRHPNVVAIHDSGVAGDVFYLLMDCIEGRSLSEYLATHPLTIHQKIQLFLKICDGVQAAHLSGVIHRDLKPGNILVNEAGEPHVLDFGLAKFTAAEAQAGVMTHTGQFVGTPPWASPEQAARDPGRVDMRTDVYSLGVIFYQMLTGAFPYDVTGAIAAVLDRILHAEPVSPRTRNAAIDDELSTITLKCLRKEPDRRYQTAGELARDLRHYVAGEPIEAKRDSVGYFIRKQIRRHRVPVAIVGAFAIIIATSFVAIFVFWRQAVMEQTRTESARAAEVQQREIAEAVNQFLDEMLSAANPASDLDRDVTMREIVDLAAARLDADSLADRPAVEAAVRDMIGRTYQGLGRHESAEHHLRKALELNRRVFGLENPAVARSLRNLGMTLCDRGAYAESEELLRESVDQTRSLFGPNAVEMADALGQLAFVVHRRGAASEAEQLCRDALKITRSHPDEDLGVATMNLQHLAVLREEAGDLAESETLLRESMAIQEQSKGPNDPTLAATLTNLARLLRNRPEDREAVDLYDRALKIQLARLGPDHPDLAHTYNELGDWRLGRDDFDAAEQHFRAAVRILRANAGDSHPQLPTALGNLAVALTSKGDYAAAEPMFRDLLELQRRRFGPTHPVVVGTLNNLAATLFKKGDIEAAEPLLREALALRRIEYPGDHPTVAQGINNVGMVLEAQGALQEAYAQLTASHEMRLRLFGPDHPDVALVLNNLGSVLNKMGQFDQAEEILCRALAIRSAVFGEDSPQVAETSAQLAKVLRETGRAAEAEALLRSALACWSAKFGDAHPRTAVMRVEWALCLIDLNRCVEAQSALLAGFESQATSEGRRTANNTARLAAQAFERAGQSDLAAEWRGRLASD